MPSPSHNTTVEQRPDSPPTTTSSDTATESTDIDDFLVNCRLNDEVECAELTGYSLDGDTARFEFTPKYGTYTFAREFDVPQKDSLRECPELVEFLEHLGWTGDNWDDLEGTTIPAQYSLSADKWVLDWGTDTTTHCSRSTDDLRRRSSGCRLLH